MSSTDLEEILYEEPFRPFRLTVASGDQVIVDNPRRALISGLSLYLGLNENPEARSGTRLKIISIPNITIAEHIDPGRRPSGRKRDH